MVGGGRGEEPRRFLRDTWQAPNPEYTRLAGHIRVRGRNHMNCPG